MLYWTLAGIAALAAIGAVAAGPLLSRVERPAYDVVETDGPIEIRRYPQLIVAEVETKGERWPAINDGFRMLAGYIFGGNAPRQKIEMTAPVEQQPAQKIAMTAPVIQESKGDTWLVRFIMPKAWSMDTLPVPQDPRVTLKTIPERKVAAITFSGRATDAELAEQTSKLEGFTRQRGLATAGVPISAFYNPPWTLPPLRRNEVMIELVQR